MKCCHTVRMVVGTHQDVEIDHIHYADLDARHMLLQQPRRSASFNRRNIASACQNNVWLSSSIICSKFPDRCPLRTMSESFIERKPLQFWLLSASNDIDVVPAAQAVIEYV